MMSRKTDFMATLSSLCSAVVRPERPTEQLAPHHCEQNSLVNHHLTIQGSRTVTAVALRRPVSQGYAAALCSCLPDMTEEMLEQGGKPSPPSNPMKF